MYDFFVDLFCGNKSSSQKKIVRFNFSVINESEVLMTINKMKNKNSSGVDEISNKLLKAIGTELSKLLTIIINQCLLIGIFPD